jgi:hypothetical protein
MAKSFTSDYESKNTHVNSLLPVTVSIYSRGTGWLSPFTMKLINVKIIKSYFPLNRFFNILSLAPEIPLHIIFL